jgi:hypothetical protein
MEKQSYMQKHDSGGKPLLLMQSYKLEPPAMQKALEVSPVKEPQPVQTHGYNAQTSTSYWHSACCCCILLKAAKQACYQAHTAATAAQCHFCSSCCCSPPT